MNAAQEAKQEIEEAVFSRGELHDIPVELHTQFFKTSDVSAKLSVLARIVLVRIVLVRIDVRQLRFRKADGRNLDVLTVVSGVIDRKGNYIAGVEKTVDMGQHAREQNEWGITVRIPFDVTPGSYFLRLVVRDSESQKIAAINGGVEIP